MAHAACADPSHDTLAEGRALAAAYGCGACHEIPGIAGARGRVGPTLDGFAQRAYIAGVLPNTHDNLTAFLLDPPRFTPQTAMPAVGLDPEEAAALARFLRARSG